MEEIVRLTIKDLEDFLRFERICFPADHINPEDWSELLEDERTFTFAIKEDDFIKAHISIYNWKGERDYIKIMTIGSHPEHRDKGHAHKLMEYTIDEGLKDDIHIFEAETRESNIKMQKIFKDFGYEMTGKVEDYYDNPREIAYRYSLEV